MSSADTSASLLTLTEVRSRHDEMRRLREEIIAKQERYNEVERWLNIVGQLIGADRLSEIISDQSTAPEHDAKASELKQQDNTGDVRAVVDGRVTWTFFLERELHARGGRLSYADAREIASRDKDLGPVLKQTDKSFHGAMSKLEKAGRAVRYGGWLYSPAEFKKAREDGTINQAVSREAAARVSPMTVAIGNFMSDRYGGASGRMIIEHIVKIEQFRDVVSRNATSVYNVLSRMVKRNELQKKGKMYFPPNSADLPATEAAQVEGKVNGFNGRSGAAEGRNIH